jgi:hypothetical protein
MRVNLTDLFLTLADDVDAGLWARTMKDRALLQSSDERVVPQYCFLHKRPYQPIRFLREGAEQIRAGILP